MKVRRANRIVSTAVAIAIGVNSDGRREGLGVKLVISDAHEGLKAAAAKVLGASWQRGRFHVMRNALVHANKTCCATRTDGA